MSVTTSAVTTIGLTAAGQWSEDKGIGIRIVVGGAAYVIGLSLIAQANEELASKFALVVLIVAMFRYIPPIARKTGLIERGR